MHLCGFQFRPPVVCTDRTTKCNSVGIQPLEPASIHVVSILILIWRACSLDNIRYWTYGIPAPVNNASLSHEDNTTIHASSTPPSPPPLLLCRNDGRLPFSSTICTYPHFVHPPKKMPTDAIGAFDFMSNSENPVMDQASPIHFF